MFGTNCWLWNDFALLDSHWMGDCERSLLTSIGCLLLGGSALRERTYIIEGTNSFSRQNWEAKMEVKLKKGNAKITVRIESCFHFFDQTSIWIKIVHLSFAAMTKQNPWCRIGASFHGLGRLEGLYPTFCAPQLKESYSKVWLDPVGCFLTWWYPHFTPQVLIIFSRQTHGNCWGNPPF